MLTRPSPDLRSEGGVMLVLFSIILPLILIIGSMVVSIGSWYTHGKHLQTKVDASAFAGGGSWGFPCAADVDVNIEEYARRYVGPHMKADGFPFVTPASTYNPQVGDVQEDQIHTVLNGPNWYDADTNPLPLEKVEVVNGSMCEAMVLDVKGTEQDSPLLWGWLPFWPDIKKKARLQIEEAHGVGNLLPIAVRVPKPVSAAAVFYDESPTAVPPGRVLDVRYFTDSTSIFQMPAGLAGLTTEASEYARVNLTSSKVGVAIALSFRKACNTFDAPGGAHPRPVVPAPGFPTATGANCFEDGYGPGATPFASVDGASGLCNQAPGGTQIVECFYSTGSPVQTMQNGLHFLRGHGTGTVGAAPPEVKSAYLEDVIEFPDCIGTAYFNSQPVLDCKARLHVKVDLGDVVEDIDPDPSVNDPQQTRIADNIEVRYKHVDASGNVLCDFGPNCALQHAVAGTQGGTITFSTQGTSSSPHLDLVQGSRRNSVAVEVRLKDSSVVPASPNCGPGQNFSDNCRWFHIGTGISSTSVNPPPALIDRFPIQRSFMGRIDDTGPVQWLRLTSDDDCDPATPTDIVTGLDSASRPFGTRCFVVEMGTKGGAARDQDELSFVFNEGTGPSQMGSVWCDPSIPSGSILIEGVIKGCSPEHGPNGFDTNPLCPDKSIMYDLPNPGAPFDDWPPIECVIRRATGSMNQLARGLQDRILGGSTTCPPDVPRYMPNGTVNPAFRWGRNYWHRNNNIYDDINFANLDGSPPTGNKLDKADPRLVTLFFTPYDSFSTTVEKEYPIVALGQFYITGWGRWQGNGFQGGAPDDPCSDGNVGNPLDGIPWGQGNEPPADLMACGGNCSGMVVWGHFVQGVLTGGGGSGSGDPCRPFQGSLQVCIPVLVE